ncbi:hypothetical protein [Spirosoma daeguense]
MKIRLYVLALVGVILFGCGKGPEPNPDLAATLEGIYNITQVKQGSSVLNLPSNGQTASIAFTRQSTHSATINFVIKQGTAVTGEQAGTVYMSGTTTNIDLYSEQARSTKIGTATKSSISITMSTSSVVTTIEGSR